MNKIVLIFIMLIGVSLFSVQLTEAAMYKSPEYGYSLILPDEWKIIKEVQSVSALSPGEKNAIYVAVIDLPKEHKNFDFRDYPKSEIERDFVDPVVQDWIKKNESISLNKWYLTLCGGVECVRIELRGDSLIDGEKLVAHFVNLPFRGKLYQIAAISYATDWIDTEKLYNKALNSFKL